MVKQVKISTARLLEITDDYNLKYLLDDDKYLMLDYDIVDGKYHGTLQLTKEEVEDSSVSLYNFYKDDKGNYYYPITMETKDVE